MPRFSVFEHALSHRGAPLGGRSGVARYLFARAPRVVVTERVDIYVNRLASELGDLVESHAISVKLVNLHAVNPTPS